ncbi:YheT family hydrolase [Flagellimonas allohymeniacidonis]|uniref:Alpha/beta fold hydrolase n=1 Tax=Flagellimonas allohymeniacidonis TaxID=2517819 RepID=A0A4Q8QBL9_9FLAO|nr:alpha/beta fold hydrolase [Allomuricauda hymeniacidonis]TAI47762.1 alpha/beta fold hydrolase [Allomuricauda hymeniacidonis]
MPLVTSKYRPSLLFRNGHFSTIYAGVMRKVEGVTQHRERITLSDGDFLDVDWSFSQTPKKGLVILLHGLEGNAQRPYITGSAKIFNTYGFDACAVNYRGCSGEPNLSYRSYHSGATEDLQEVIHHILKQKDYDAIYLKGFSLGGNLLLKYLGESNEVSEKIKGAIAVSVPCSLRDSCDQLLTAKNVLYAKRFKKHLIAKLRQKQKMFPDLIPDSDIKAIITLKDFDDIYTSRAHNFRDAFDYYAQCSSLQFLREVNIPVLLINASDDSFLGNACYPYAEADKNKNLFLEVPSFGGHVGFWDKDNISYTEKRAIEFLREMGQI